MKKTCPRCGTPFTCQADQIEHCDCAGVALDDETRQQIELRFEGCLCLRCLRTLKAESGRTRTNGGSGPQGLLFAPPMHLRGCR